MPSGTFLLWIVALLPTTSSQGVADVDLEPLCWVLSDALEGQLDKAEAQTDIKKVAGSLGKMSLTL